MIPHLQWSDPQFENTYHSFILTSCGQKCVEVSQHQSYLAVSHHIHMGGGGDLLLDECVVQL